MAIQVFNKNEFISILKKAKAEGWKKLVIKRYVRNQGFDLYRQKEAIVLSLGFQVKLEHLPSEISLITTLEYLEISDTYISLLPSELGKLTRLKTLIVVSNKLKSLPLEIQQLEQLETLDLRDNNLPIPPEILKKINEPKTILHSYFIPRYPILEAKVILIGQGNVGKTSLVRRLTENTFDPHENKTDGIAVCHCEIEEKKSRGRL